MLVAILPSEEIMLAALSSIGKMPSSLEEEDGSVEADVSEETLLELETPSSDDESNEGLVSVLQDARANPRSSRDILFFLIAYIVHA